MKWGSKKPPSSTSYYSRPSLISHVFPTSWLTKLKQMSINPGQEHAKVKQKGKWNSVSTNSMQFAAGGEGEGGRFYGGDGDAFWRLSFGTDSADGEKSRGVLRSFQYDLDDDPEFPPSSCHSCRSNAARLNNSKEEAFKFSDMVSEVRKARGLPREEEILPEMDMREKVAEIRTPRLRVEREKKLRKANRRVREDKRLVLHGEPDEAERKPRKASAQTVFEMESERTIGIIERKDCILTDSYSRKGCFISSTDSNDIAYASKVKDCSTIAAQRENDRSSSESLRSEWQKLKEMKIEEFKSKSEKQRKSLYISRELQRKRHKQNSKGRAFSPRATPKLETCRIKALENMKAAKSKTKKKTKQKTMEGFTGLESFAVVKCSFDPQKDFRDSMIEMIEEKRISKPEELEELLACYLTLNADEYHDLIIKVFRQVWFDLNQAYFDTELDKEQCYHE